MAIGIGEGAEMRAPMAITVIGGVLVTTFLTLLVIPVVYSVLDRKVVRAAGARRADARGRTGHGLRLDHAPHRVSRCSRPVTTVMVFLAVLAVGLISARLLPLETFPDISFPGMQVDHPLPRLDARGNRTARSRARSRKRSRRCPASRRSRRRARARRGAVHDALRLGRDIDDGGVRGAHQARLDPLASCRPARTAS